MEWNFKYPNKDFYYSLVERGAITELAPDVSNFMFYIESFNELSSCRNTGYGIGQIPFTAIAEYAKIYEVEDFDEFLFLMRVMDSKYIGLQNAKNGNKESNPKNKGARR